MKKIAVLTGCLLIVGCDSNNDKSNTISEENIQKKEVLTPKAKEIFSFLLKDDFKTLSDGGESVITEFYPIYTADQITNDYAKNEIKANISYKGKEFFINGTIGGIEADFYDNPVVNFKTKGNYGFNSPLLSFDKSEDKKISELNKGQKITFLCTGKSEVAGSPILDKCLFLDTVKKNILDSFLEFEDQDLSEGNSQHKKAVFTYVSTVFMLQLASNNFEKCKEINVACSLEILKSISKENVKNYKDKVRLQFPKAMESIDKIKVSERN